MNRPLLVLLLLIPLTDSWAQESPLIEPGDWVRFWREWPFDDAHEGSVVGVDADTLVVKEATYETILSIPLTTLTKLEVRRGEGIMGRYWELVLLRETPMAQANQQFWVNMGTGEGTISGLAVGVGFSYQTGNHLISIRAIKEYERIVWNEEKAWEVHGDVDSPGRQNWDVGLLYGRIFEPKYVSVSLSTGLSLAGGVRRGKFLTHRPRRGNVYEKLAIRTLGIPVEVQVSRIISGSDLGFGLYGYADLNPEVSFAGVLLFLQLGKRH